MQRLVWPDAAPVPAFVRAPPVPPAAGAWPQPIGARPQGDRGWDGEDMQRPLFFQSPLVSLESIRDDIFSDVGSEHAADGGVGVSTRVLEADPVRVDDRAPGPVEVPDVPRKSPLTQLEADHMFHGRSARRQIPLPAAWARKFDPATVVYSFCDETPGAEMIGRGRLAAKPDFELAFSAWTPGDPATVRQERMSQILSYSGFAPTLFEKHDYPEGVFMLTESPGMRTIADLIAEGEAREAGGAHAPVVPLETALPLMGDMLRGLEALTAMGVVLGDLSEHSIYIIDNDTHAMIVDFRSAGLVDSLDADTSCSGLAGGLHGSAFRHAPEMEDGLPSEVPNNIWQLGLVFARMVLGGEALTEIEVKRREADLDDTTEEGGRKVRALLREHFSAKEALANSGLREEYDDILTLIEGMLVKSPEHRWTAQMAFVEATDIATTRGVSGFTKRWPRSLPRDWGDDAA